jgi:plastocyanin
MIWRSLIFSNLAAGAFILTAGSLSGATVSGTVVLKDSHVQAVSRGKDFSGVVISAEPVNAAPPPAAPVHVTMLQKGKTFTPHILPAAVGTMVDFPNSDPVFHNVFSSYDGQIFDLGLYPPGTSRSLRLTRAGVLRVFCNIHPAMSAIILALNTPYFTKTAKDGSWALTLPPGTYSLSVFHERATDRELAGLVHRIVVPGEGLRLQPITISEASYLVVPHKNKYGRDYGPPPDDEIFYPGPRNRF